MFLRLWVRAPRTTSGLRAFCGLVASGIPTVTNSPGTRKRGIVTTVPALRKAIRTSATRTVGFVPGRVRSGCCRGSSRASAPCSARLPSQARPADRRSPRPRRRRTAARVQAHRDSTCGSPRSAIAPIDSRIRSSVGPTPANDIRNTPRTAVARNTSPETSRYATSSDSAIDRRHESRARQPGHQERDADDVEDVIDVEAVARPLDAADPRQRAVEAVAEPVDAPARRPRPRASCCPSARARSRARPAPSPRARARSGGPNGSTAASDRRS